jgi:hypothetical protein
MSNINESQMHQEVLRAMAPLKSASTVVRVLAAILVRGSTGAHVFSSNPFHALLFLDATTDIAALVASEFGAKNEEAREAADLAKKILTDFERIVAAHGSQAKGVCAAAMMPEQPHVKH